MTLTCRAVSDGGATTIEKTFKVDKTAPSANAFPSRGADVNGWYNQALTVTFQGGDATSGLDSCTAPVDYGAPDSANASVGGSCRDLAGNGAPTSFSFKYDETAPTNQGGTPSRPADANGWHNHALTVTFHGADDTSGTSACTQRTYDGPDDPSVALTGTCTDRAGNESPSAAFTLKYDETAPTNGGGSPSRPADKNGWYNAPLTVNFAGTDATSGIDTCTRVDYSGPDSGSASVPGTCRDLAGNPSGATTFPFKYDATAPALTPAPSRPADHNGWYNQALSVSFPGTDATSGIDLCTGPQNYTGPDNATATVPGSCSDKAGNNTAKTFALKYDATAPALTPAPSRPADHNGWYNQALSVSFPGTDATSGIDLCTGPQNYTGPDNATATVPGSCSDKAGNNTAKTFALKYDATAPALTPAPSRPADHNGWYNQALSVSFPGTDATSGIDLCTGPQNYTGPDNATATVPGSCSDKAGNNTAKTFALKYDATGPQVTPSPSRAPNVNGWYNQALTVNFGGTDATSGLDACETPKSYSGPDSNSASVSSSCLDKAGNSGSATFPLKYDATAPANDGGSPSRAPDSNGWYNHDLTITFGGGDATSGIQSCTQAPYGAPDSTNASVPGSCTDKAGNLSTSRNFSFQYDETAPTLTPTPSRPADKNGWYNQALTVSFPGADATSGIDVCTTPQTYSGPDNSDASVSGACVDKAGNTTAKAFGLKYDATGPALAPAPSRSADHNGWYNQALTVTFPGTDAASGIDLCTGPQNYTGPDNANASVQGNCSDKAGNTTAKSFALKYDATGPALIPAPSRPADHNGWYNQALTVSFPGTDATSGIDLCTGPQNYTGPDNATATVPGSCTDKAGNTIAKSFTLKYDATGPALTPAPSRPADHNGWYNQALTVSFPGADATSGIDVCTAAQPYSGPDNGAASVPGSCSDKAGNTTAKAFGLKFDSTTPQLTPAPSRPANVNGWHNQALTVTFPGTDATSGIDLCTAPQPYSGPDNANATVPGSCTDKAGNATAKTFALKYDATNPKVDGATPARPPEPSGWYLRPVVFSFQGSDVTSGIDACPSVRYEGPDGANVNVTGACLDKAGNIATRPFPLKYDDTGPVVAASPERGPDVNGWYNHRLAVNFTGSDDATGLASCGAPTVYEGPDSVFAVVVGTCTDLAGNVGVGSLAIKYDATPPQVDGARADRQPDGNGWYNHPLTVSFFGSDATSDIDACTTVGYSGPSNPSAGIAGSCRDRAGNSSNGSAFGFKYDNSAPTVTVMTVKAGNRSAVLTWATSSDTALVELARTAGTRPARTTVYRGTGQTFTDTGLENGVRYRYTLTGYDEAQNAATAEAAATPNAPLVSPKAGAVVSSPPLLAWRAVPKATYYNAQVWRNGRIYSSWPKGTSVQLRRTWIYNGRRYRLSPGRYRWYVWPGYGKRAKKDFGRLIGSSSFVVK